MTNETEVQARGKKMSEMSFEDSQKLDALVAVEIMGWSLFGRMSDWQDAGSPVGDKIHIVTPDLHFASIAPRNSIPGYSTDLKTAFKVVPKMRSLGWRFFCEDLATFDLKDEWWFVELTRPGKPGACGYSENLATAICIAALKSMGVIDVSDSRCLSPHLNQKFERLMTNYSECQND